MTNHAPDSQRRDDPLAQIRRSFLSRLGDRCLAIDAILERDAGRGISREDRDFILHHAHRTAGIAASLGFGTLGTLASVVEAEWANIPPDAAETASAVDATHRFLDEIERVLDADLVA